MDAKTFLRNHIAEIVEIDEDTFEEVFTFFKPKQVKRKELLIRGGNCFTRIFCGKGLSQNLLSR
jgi:hypothetical protein